MITRDEHLSWCKQRALEYVEGGELQDAFASMASDVLTHPETKHHHETNKLGIMLLMAGQLETPGTMRSWIEGYN